MYYCLSKILKYAVDEGAIQSNPLTSVRPSTRKNDIPKEMQIWEQHDFDRFIAVVDDPMYRCTFMMLYYMGLRRGEMQALKWGCIDLTNKTIRVEYTYSDGELTPPKTKESIRTITMPNVLAKEMASWQRISESFSGYGKDSFVFGHAAALPDETLRRHFINAIALCNAKGKANGEDPIPVIRIHDLRHSHASFLINNMSAGFTDFDIAKRLGHSVTMLHKTYAHWFKSADQKIIDFMNNN